ncbi:malto-oligosyltrehalose trehalohydrolase [Botryobacter ruber]|uniref:malto-oligosyltrehalose trehalohydrolase n=1 Tax=Botryobacter ruber TaxID=2171629 RepID=UPI000E09E7B0|nr:malto-oligosyltrehalose trehalohydrolase [Botryobacter ruber]
MNTLGAEYRGNNRCAFTVWAPEKDSMYVHLVSPRKQKVKMKKDKLGFYRAEVDKVAPGSLYYFMPDGEKDFPDPASHFQPEGVHGPSQVVDHSAYVWHDEHWHGLPFKDLILYEIHVGTFTPEGTFKAIIPRLDELAETGINAIELMPVSQFPGSRNWGYDGTYPYAVQNSYGGPDGLKALVDACHMRGIAVFLDVVYNHQGPEGNYFSMFGPYFTDKYSTPWGDAINFDADWSDGVREYYSNNPLHWFEHYHIDGLRLDAIHTLYDKGAISFWELTYGKIKLLEQKLGRALYMTAESDFNSPRVTKSPEIGGYGFDAQWLDDFHHALYVLLHDKGKKYYTDFGQMEQLAKGYTDGFVHSGEFVSFRCRKHGASSAGVPGDKFIVFTQNHDQVGNHVGSVRLSSLVNFEQLKIGAAAILLAPYVPMLFMGEEYAEDAPFYYFVSHSDENLIKSVQEGRKREFSKFNWPTDPPDPQAEETFNNSKLAWEKRKKGKYCIMLKWYRELIRLRRSNPVLQNFNKDAVQVHTLGQKGFVLIRRSENEDQHLICLFNLSQKRISYTFPEWDVNWQKILDSKEENWLPKKSTIRKLMPDKVKAAAAQEIPPLSVAVYASEEKS